MFDTIRNLFRSPPKPRSSSLGAGRSDEDDDRFPDFQTAWKPGPAITRIGGVPGGGRPPQQPKSGQPHPTQPPAPRPATTFDPKAEAKRWMTWFDDHPRRPAEVPSSQPRDPFHGHDIDTAGATWPTCWAASTGSIPARPPICSRNCTS